MRGDLTHGVAHQLVESLRFGRITIQRFGQLRRAIGKEPVQRINVAAKNLGQHVATPLCDSQPCGGLCEVRRRRRDHRGYIRRRQRDHSERITLAQQHAILAEDFQQAIEQPVIARQNAERGTERRGAHRLA